ncbi:hypothetical protein MKW94_003849 [Papaver nudicaule]|uniref:Uncharacterized protein n=1 Tax=Papaver nudicaule TaxID=74823 RepID=A0AA41SEY7_PAPNU|nr:hypothetical protein [Papaver nudicaule]
MRLNKKADRNSFGLTCRQWLHIQNNNCRFLSYHKHNPKMIARFGVDASYTMVLGKLLNRFPNLKSLLLEVGHPEVTEFLTSKFESEVQRLVLDGCCESSHIEPSPVFSWFPRLTSIILTSHHITDKGLEELAKRCTSLKDVDFRHCDSVTDSEISLLLRNCPELVSLCFLDCSSITEGINAIVSGGGLEYVTLYHDSKSKEGSITTEAIATIAKGCPLLKELILSNCEEVELQGWQAIGRNCQKLEYLCVYGCRKLCDLGLQALCDGCNKLSRLLVDDENSCSRSALELFKRKRPSVMCHLQRDFKCPKNLR